MNKIMTDKQAIQHTMQLFNFRKDEEVGPYVLYSTRYDGTSSQQPVSLQGYDNFEAGFEFDEEGNLVRGFMDSHVAWRSVNLDIIKDKIKELK